MKPHLTGWGAGPQHVGICYLVENNFLEWRAESVAEFIYKEEGLNKTAIGNFLGEREDMHIEVLKAFVNLHQFFHLNLVQALRRTDPEAEQKPPEAPHRSRDQTERTRKQKAQAQKQKQPRKRQNRKKQKHEEAEDPAQQTESRRQA
ncbi:unnamed protein product [Arctogadus glacialis]